ncbi:hypothetical protein [Leptolyngbya sp. KIOST-1]|uniref:hypothetical protein n=1 Tax=Leptolyngbya sp. KIOST-1 TaxID=1229172 RepID=UPI00056A195B|nr:hypothetical protein [Leptolyngbya sp. KIOST-1]
MRDVTIVIVTDDRRLEIPPEVQAQLHPGDEYMIWATDDAITFKKIQKPLRFDELQERIDALEPDPDAMSLEEISALVKEVRRQMKSETSAAE